MVKALDSLPLNGLKAVLAKTGVPPYLICVIMRMNLDIKESCTVGARSVWLSSFVMQACLKSLDMAIPADLVLQEQSWWHLVLRKKLVPSFVEENKKLRIRPVS